MGQRIRSGLTFSNVVALLALFIALGGSVYAASKIDGKTIKKGSLPGNRVVPDSLKGKQINESKLGEVPSAAIAGSAQPVAFAQINSDGTVNANRSKGVTGANVTHPDTGAYCVSGLGFEVKGAQVSIQFGGSRGTTAQFTPGNTGTCPNGGQVLLSDNANNAANLTFQIVLYG